MLQQSVGSLRGVGEAKQKALESKAIYTMRDLLYYFPRDYQDYSVCTDVANALHAELAALRLMVVKKPALVRVSKGMQMVTASAQDETGVIQLVWFNQPYRKNQIEVGDTRIFCGRVDTSHGVRLLNPMVTTELPGILPIYPFIKGMAQYQIRAAVKQALLGAVTEVEETLPGAFMQQHALCGLQEALRHVHFPKDMDMLRCAKHRLSFEDMLYYLLAIALLKQARKGKAGIAFSVAGLANAFLRELPYTLTNAQLRVIAEISADMQSVKPMNRLVQGDVGAGKTVLALYALYVAAQNGYQGVLMAPTELLARQHYALLKSMYADKVCLLFGSMKKAEKESAYARVENGDVSFVVGTHALLQPGLVFEKLGVVVADEQHRFGVRQRAQLANKAAIMPDVLIMSATPIPRTLSMLLFGDLDLSVLDELPPGRRPVMTRLVPEEKRRDMYGFIEKQVQAGRQAYVVCPLIEPGEESMREVRSAQQVHQELVLLLPHLRIAIMHGRMAAGKKEETVQAFRDGNLDILVSTTVVEVGVDIPNATVMVIEHADRFGLAQLHQLRGRVGRGAAQSFCFLLNGSQSESARARISIMTSTHDGFVIAQKDLELRGPGEFLGTRQHGTAGMQAVNMAQNMEVLLQAQLAADSLLSSGETEENACIFARAQALYESRMREIAQN